ncbi:Uncharacterised protein [Vibrio cholerae]|nr:Uncharacterised protein [Vibrio cholerae]
MRNNDWAIWHRRIEIQHRAKSSSHQSSKDERPY